MERGDSEKKFNVFLLLVCFGFHVKTVDWVNLIFLREEKR